MTNFLLKKIRFSRLVLMVVKKKVLYYYKKNYIMGLDRTSTWNKMEITILTYQLLLIIMETCFPWVFDESAHQKCISMVYVNEINHKITFVFYTLIKHKKEIWFHYVFLHNRNTFLLNKHKQKTMFLSHGWRRHRIKDVR